MIYILLIIDDLQANQIIELNQRNHRQQIHKDELEKIKHLKCKFQRIHKLLNNGHFRFSKF